MTLPSIPSSSTGRGWWRVIPWVLGLAVLTFSVGLLATAYMGSFMRLSGDDYCYGAVVRQHGFLQAQAFSYLHQPPYHGDRFSSTFISGLVTLAGPSAWSSWTGLTLLGWAAATLWCGWQVAVWAKMRRPLLGGLLGAAIVVFLTVYQAPDRVQSVYWWSANVLYLTPLVLEWIILGLILWASRTARRRPLALAMILILAFVAGGFSEAVAAFQMTWLILALATVLAYRQRHSPNRRTLISALVVASLGAGLSLIALAASPFARRGLESLGSHPPAVLLLKTALRGGFGFLRETLQGLPLPTAVTLALGGVLGVILGLERDTNQRRRWQNMPLAALFLLGVAIILAAAVLTPSLYAYNTLSDARALLPARHAMVLAFLGIGLAAGFTVGTVMPPEMKRSALLTGVLAAAVALAAVYPLWGARQIVADVSTYRRWANAWDERHAEILRARASGEVDLHVMLIDHIIPSVSELTADPTFWYNTCAADYYGVRSITADLPGWDD